MNLDIGCEQETNQLMMEQVQRYEEVFHQDEMKNERRIISHARNDPQLIKFWKRW